MLLFSQTDITKVSHYLSNCESSQILASGESLGQCRQEQTKSFLNEDNAILVKKQSNTNINTCGEAK